jgi:hypothetical protein
VPVGQTPGPGAEGQARAVEIFPEALLGPSPDFPAPTSQAAQGQFAPRAGELRVSRGQTRSARASGTATGPGPCLVQAAGFAFFWGAVRVQGNREGVGES